MDQVARRTYDLQLHTEKDGSIWCAKDDDLADRLDLTPDQLIELPLAREAQRINLLGVAENAELIARLYESQALSGGREPGEVRIGGPRVCSLLGDVQPSLVLRQLRNRSAVGSLGGWHSMTEDDYCTYRLIELTTKKPSDWSHRIQPFVELHPSYPAISFVRCDCTITVAYLISEIVDPRWHINPAQPDRRTTLYRHLGVLESPVLEQADAARRGGPAPISRRARRAGLMLAAVNYGRDGYADELASPGSFLWREARKTGDDRSAVRRVCRRFAVMLSDVWRHYASSPAPDGLFVPEYFFKYAEDSRDYRAHTASLSPRFAEESCPARVEFDDHRPRL